MANYYWGKREDDLCFLWTNTGNTQSDYTRIHKLLYPKVFKLCEAIMNRYYSVPYPRQSDLLCDCVQEVFLKLPLFNPEKSKSYSFCSMIAKHYIHEEIVSKPTWVKRIQIDLTDTGEFTDDKQPIDYGESFQIDFNEVLRYFAIMKHKVLVKLKKMSKKDSLYNQHRKKYDNHIMIIDLAVEFVEKFHSVDASAMADYIYLNSKSSIRKTTIVNYFRAMLGFNVTIRINMHGKDLESKFDDNYHYLQDDYTPEESKWAIRGHRKKRIKASPETEKYQYM